jgi:hypothetical protein
MSNIVRVAILALALWSGCARPDWIQQTLVTVDVTGTWLGRGDSLELKLEQQGSKVTGSIVVIGAQYFVPRISGPIDGSVAGDVFRFKQTGGSDVRFEGEMTVSGDEMTGNVRSVHFTRGQATLRRVDSSRPGLQQQ